MDCDNEDRADSDLPSEIADLRKALTPLVRRLRGVKKAMKMLTGSDLTRAGTKALESRLHLYRTKNLVNEAQSIADATALPLPVVFDNLVRQRRMDELTIEVLRRVSDKDDTLGNEAAQALESSSENNTDRWYHTFSEEAGKVDEEDVREAFTRILVGEIKDPGSFSVRTLRVVGGISQSTAKHFLRAASVSIRLTLGGTDTHDVRIPEIGGNLAHNYLKSEGLSYRELIDLTENGLVHPDYHSSYPYGPIELHGAIKQKFGPNFQIPFVHQGRTWMLIPIANSQKSVRPLACGWCDVDLLRYRTAQDRRH